MSKNMPNVIVAGFPKSGSTFLYHLLKQHPDIYIPKIKEVNYFNKDHFFIAEPEILNPRYFKPLKWYYSFFKSDKKVKIDFSILSSLDMSSASRIRRTLGDIKIIFITRNKEDFLNSMRSFIEKEGGQPEAVSRYADLTPYIKNYKNYFSKVLVIKLEDINKNPEKEFGKITKFLEIPAFKFNLKVPRHETSTYNMGLFQYMKRHGYIFLVKSFYKFISFTVTANLKARGEK